jgi:tetratricopeptide (TPR) repeat protein
MLKKGREAAQKAIALNPDFPSSWQELGDSYGYAGNHEESLKAYQQELKLDPESMTAQSDVARALALTAKRPEQYRDAVARIESLLKRNVMNPGAAYSLLGDLHLRFGHYQEARKALEYSLKEDATIPDIYYKLAQARRLAGDSAGAAQATSQYKEMSYHYQRTRTLQKQASEAPDNADLHLKLAREWEYYKAWPQVEQAYREVLRIRPADPEATQGLSKLRRMAEQGKAVTPYNWVLERLLRQSQNAVQVQASEASGSTPPSPSGLK